jgi:hypothetical protein
MDFGVEHVANTCKPLASVPKNIPIFGFDIRGGTSKEEANACEDHSIGLLKRISGCKDADLFRLCW